MARRGLHALAAGALIGGTLFVAAPASAATCVYPCVTPGGGGGGGTTSGGTTSGGGGGGGTTTSGGGTGTTAAGGGGTQSGGNLPFTGAEILPVAGTAGVLLVVGTTVLIAGRRRGPSTDI